MKRFAIYRRDWLVGLTWADCAADALRIHRRFTNELADFAREEAL